VEDEANCYLLPHGPHFFFRITRTTTAAVLLLLLSSIFRKSICFLCYLRKRMGDHLDTSGSVEPHTRFFFSSSTLRQAQYFSIHWKWCMSLLSILLSSDLVFLYLWFIRLCPFCITAWRACGVENTQRAMIAGILLRACMAWPGPDGVGEWKYELDWDWEFYKLNYNLGLRLLELAMG
jgi:hypothetical protein